MAQNPTVLVRILGSKQQKPIQIHRNSKRMYWEDYWELTELQAEEPGTFPIGTRAKMSPQRLMYQEVELSEADQFMGLLTLSMDELTDEVITD